MKPDWKDAPDWANYLTMSKDGDWRWHQMRPEIAGDEWVSGGREMHARYQEIIDWRTTSESRA